MHFSVIRASCSLCHFDVRVCAREYCELWPFCQRPQQTSFTYATLHNKRLVSSYLLAMCWVTPPSTACVVIISQAVLTVGPFGWRLSDLHHIPQALEESGTSLYTLKSMELLHNLQHCSHALMYTLHTCCSWSGTPWAPCYVHFLHCLLPGKDH